MENLLEIDLNEFASKQIASKISTLEGELKLERKRNSELNHKISDIQKQLDNSKTSLFLLDHIRQEFSKIKTTEETHDQHKRGKAYNQFVFIDSILLNIFNIKKEASGWYSNYTDGGLAPHLAVNFYSNKEVVINLLRAIMPDCTREIDFIKSFRMPYDYPKEGVIRYVKNPNYNTNGAIFGIGRYWLEHGTAEKNMPHDLIMKNPFILEDDVFKILLNSIKKKTPNFQYLFALPIYNKDITKEQIQALGDLLPSVGSWSDDIRTFIEQNLKIFNENTLDYLYSKATSDNQFNTLHWEKFPEEYQMRFLMDRSLDKVLPIITNYSRTWTLEQKEIFLKRYMNR